MQDRNSDLIDARDDDKQPERAAFKTVNADDNPIDEHGKTKRDYEVERAQKDANKTERDDRGGQRNNPVQGDPEFRRHPNSVSGDGKVVDSGDALNLLNAAGAEVDPRNRVNEASRRPPVPGVDKERGGSSDDANGGVMGSKPDAQKYPLPNPNNPDSPNNPASTAVQDRLAASPTPPLPVGERTTHETPMDGKSDVQRADEASHKADDKDK